MNDELRLDGALSNRELSLNTFTNVILRPADMYSANLSTDRKIVNLFIDKYDEVRKFNVRSIIFRDKAFL